MYRCTFVLRWLKAEHIVCIVLESPRNKLRGHDALLRALTDAQPTGLSPRMALDDLSVVVSTQKLVIRIYRLSLNTFRLVPAFRSDSGAL